MLPLNEISLRSQVYGVKQRRKRRMLQTAIRFRFPIVLLANELEIFHSLEFDAARWQPNQSTRIIIVSTMVAQTVLN